MKWPPLQPATFVRRDNRFRATVRLPTGSLVAAHVPNSGRLHDLFVPGRPVWLARATRTGRKTPYDLLLVQLPHTWVSVDARLPNPLFREALAAGQFADWLPDPTAWQVRAEPAFAGGRLDFCLQHRATGQRVWVETKSVTLVEGGVALFPDAPTARGRRHLAALARRVAQGERAAVVFVVQRGDARAFAPHPHADPEFPAALQAAAHAGVEVYAYDCRVTQTAIAIAGRIPVCWEPETCRSSLPPTVGAPYSESKT